jgi:hypothetical protein
MQGLFYLSGILITLSGQLLIRGIKTKKRREVVIGSLVMAASIAYAVYYLFFVD